MGALDIFFTHIYQYILEEDAGSVSVRLAKFLGRDGSMLAENGFRLGHPWTLLTPAYLSGSYDPMHPTQLDAPPKTLIDVRIRPNFLLVVITYAAAVLLILDILGIELFWKSQYLLRLALVCGIGLLSLWAIFSLTTQLRKQFESAILSPPDNPIGSTP